MLTLGNRRLTRLRLQPAVKLFSERINLARGGGRLTERVLSWLTYSITEIGTHGDRKFLSGVV